MRGPPRGDRRGRCERPLVGRRSEEGRGRVEELEARRLRLREVRSLEIAEGAAELRHHLGDVPGTGTKLVTKHGRVGGTYEPPNDLHPGPVRRGPAPSQHRPTRTLAPASRARAASLSARRVLPIPGSPDRRIRRPRPASAASRASPSSASSRSRPTNTAPPPGGEPALGASVRLNCAAPATDRRPVSVPADRTRRRSAYDGHPGAPARLGRRSVAVRVPVSCHAPRPPDHRAGSQVRRWSAPRSARASSRRVCTASASIRP